MNKILLIDGNSILNRAFYGLPDLTNKDGKHTNAVLGFLNIIFKVIEEEQCNKVCVAFDVKEKTFRHIKFSEYKGTRKPMPEELRQQVPLIKEVLKSMEIFTIEKGGYEADDILGTISNDAAKAGYMVTVLSGDRDLLQLATKQIQIRIPKTKSGKTTIESYYPNDVIKLYGVDPKTFIDMKGLMGDSSDNIPGVPGIGEKTASKLLIEYGSLEKIYENIQNMKPSKMRDNLENNKEMAFLSRELATIKLDCELTYDYNDMDINNMFNEKSYNLFRELEFKSLLGRFNFDLTKQQDSEIEIEKIIIETITEYHNLILDIKETKNPVGIFLVSNDNDVLAVSLSFKQNISYFVPCNRIDISILIEDIKLLISENDIKFIFMDLKSNLLYFDLIDSKNLIDISLATYLIDPLSSTYSYDLVGKKYANIDFQDEKTLIGKEEINLFSMYNDNIMSFIAYNSYVPFLCWENVSKKLFELDMLDLYYEIELPCLYSLYEMEKNGIKVDSDALKKYGKKLQERIDELVLLIYKEVGHEFNINSTKQLGEVLFEEMGLKHGKKTKTGYSTSVEVLEKLQNEHIVIKYILEYRQLTKLNSTYVEGLSIYIAPDGRIHGKFNQTVTATGRISSTEPNLQNIPTRLPLGREIRKVFIPEKDYVFVGADYSQIELRVLAHMSDDETLISAYNKNDDIHSITASECFGVPIEEVDDLMRRRAKAVNFGIVYGISAFGLGQDLDISRKEAEGYIQKYFETYSKVKLYLDSIVDFAKQNGYALTMYKRRRPIPELKSSNFMTRSFGERAAMNSPIQGSAADIIKIAMVNVYKALKQKQMKSRLVLQIHDELIIETHKDEIEEVKQLLKQEMTNASSLKVPLIIDMHSGNNWYETK